MMLAGAFPIQPPPMTDRFEGGAGRSASTSWSVGEILAPAEIRVDAQVQRKREALALLATMLSEKTGKRMGSILAALLRRERLGPTYIGEGIAMPHARLEETSTPAAAVLRLRRPVDYATADDDAADLLVALVWPDAEPHGFVETLARLWRLLRDPSAARAFREAGSPEELHALFAAFDGDRRQ